MGARTFRCVATVLPLLIAGLLLFSAAQTAGWTQEDKPKPGTKPPVDDEEPAKNAKKKPVDDEEPSKNPKKKPVDDESPKPKKPPVEEKLDLGAEAAKA